MHLPRPQADAFPHNAVPDLAITQHAAQSPSEGALTLSLINADQIDDALRAEWRALLWAAHDPNPYFAPWFLEPALRHLDPAGEVRLCLLRMATGKLAGLAPFVVQQGYAKLPLKHLCIWTHQHCFNGAPLIREGYAETVYGAMFDWIDTRPDDAMFLRFAMLPFDHATHATLEAACTKRDRALRVQSYHERAILTSGNDFEDVISTAMSGKKRKELRRQERRFSELGNARLVSLPIRNGSAIEDFLELENKGWKANTPDGFPLAQSDAEARFFREAMIGGAAQGAIGCHALTLDGAPKAMLFNLRAGNQLAAFKTSYDEEYAAYSPGVHLLIEATRHMLDSDIQRYDSCARAGHPVVDGLWTERLPIAQVNVPSRQTAHKTLLGTAATLEKLKNSALRRLRRGVA